MSTSSPDPPSPDRRGLRLTWPGTQPDPSRSAPPPARPVKAPDSGALGGLPSRPDASGADGAPGRAGSLPDDADVAMLRAEVASLWEAIEEVAGLRADLRELSNGANGAVADQIAGLRGDITALRRRITLRLDGGGDLGPPGGTLSSAQLDELADLITERLGEAMDRSGLS